MRICKSCYDVCVSMKNALKDIKYRNEFGTNNGNEVVQAQKQVVQGFKYYMKVSAIENGKLNLCDAVVVVQAWIKPPNELIRFNPSS
ncbi:hypothetical protein C5167_027192 [Papaver somniferum]|nr:hypothetical protein C5167_027192 [Papaver somniferum]